MEELLRILKLARQWALHNGVNAPPNVEGIPHREELAKIGQSFLSGFQMSMELPFEQLLYELNSQPVPVRGFYFEGATTGLASLDLTNPNGWERVKRLVEAAPEQVIVCYLGIGEALSHLGVVPEAHQSALDQLWAWFSLDGYGFHQGYFQWKDSIRDQHRPQLSLYGSRAFDQGIGRAMWFVGAANPDLIKQMISSFPRERRPDLWSGIGIQASYCGGADERDLRRLLNAASRYETRLQQGVAFGTKARLDAQNVPDFTEGACNIICGASSKAVGEATEECLAEVQQMVATPERSVHLPPTLLWQRQLCQRLSE